MTEIRSDEETVEEERLERQTSEGAQELQPRSRTQEVVITGGGMWPEADDALDDTMIINMGPQHPSTHIVNCCSSRRKRATSANTVRST